MTTLTQEERKEREAKAQEELGNLRTLVSRWGHGLNPDIPRRTGSSRRFVVFAYESLSVVSDLITFAGLMSGENTLPREVHLNLSSMMGSQLLRVVQSLPTGEELGGHSCAELKEFSAEGLYLAESRLLAMLDDFEDDARAVLRSSVTLLEAAAQAVQHAKAIDGQWGVSEASYGAIATLGALVIKAGQVLPRPS